MDPTTFMFANRQSPSYFISQRIARCYQTELYGFYHLSGDQVGIGKVDACLVV